MDHSFSVFALGLVVGAVSALLLGTKKGRALSQEILNSLPDINFDQIKPQKEVKKEIKTPSSPPPIPNWPSAPSSSPQYFSQNKDAEINW